MRKFAVVVLAGVSASVFSAPAVGTAVPDYPCGSANGWNTAANGATCGFAFNVARGVNPYSRGGELTVMAYSPATGANYSVVCRDATQRSEYSNAYECSILSQRGGVVYLWQ
jgi:hypothetical protein